MLNDKYFITIYQVRSLECWAKFISQNFVHKVKLTFLCACVSLNTAKCFINEGFAVVPDTLLLSQFWAKNENNAAKLFNDNNLKKNRSAIGFLHLLTHMVINLDTPILFKCLNALLNVDALMLCFVHLLYAHFYCVNACFIVFMHFF